MLQVIWAPEAEETFDAIHTHILNNWGAHTWHSGSLRKNQYRN
jgi:plasmid stabilization system protein ParE